MSNAPKGTRHGRKARMRRAVVRFQIEVAEIHLKELELLMCKTDARSNRELFDAAVTAYIWMVEQTEEGHEVGCLINGVFVPVIMPSLRKVLALRKEPKE